jgi:hypothetical protein
MMDIKAITDEANRRIHEKYPLYEEPIKDWMVKVILDVLEQMDGESHD